MSPTTSLHQLFTVFLIFAPTILSQVHDDNICGDVKCSSFNCATPSCNCARFDPPKDIAKEWVPQFVLLTFNRVVKKEFYAPFKQIFKNNRRNPSGVRITSTVFVSDSDGNKNTLKTDYCLVQKIFEDGHEIGSNSESHKLPLDWWRSKASLKDWTDELDGQRAKLTNETNLPDTHVTGARAPWLQAGGDLQFRAMYTAEGFTYDSSLVLPSNSNNGGYWPFTFDYNDGIQCDGNTGVCPKNCYPGLWEVPVQTLEGPKGARCTHLDYCVADADEGSIYATLMSNYHRRRNSNRAPLMISINNGWFQRNEDAVKALIKFVDRILEDEDTFIVSISQMLAWMQDPVPIDRLNEVPELYNLPKRDAGFCNTGRGDSYEQAFFISGNTMVILEVAIFTVVLLYLIAKDMD